MFRFVDRHAAKHLVIAPGWGFDHRIFAGLDWPYDCYIFNGPRMSSLDDDVKALASRLDTGKVSLLGWSKGAFAVCEFAGKNPELIDELFLVGVRRKYSRTELKDMQAGLEKNRAACLKRFYRHCFAKAEMEQYQWFKGALLKSYLETMSMEQLTKDLNWLGQAEIHPQDLQRIEKVKFIHGADDAIAPVDQAIALARSLPQAQFITFEQTGHMPFLRDDFQRRVYGH